MEKTGRLLPLGGVSSRDAGDVLARYGNTALMNLLKLIGIRKTFVRADGCIVWDEDGISYIDCLGAYGALPFGHRPKFIIDALVQDKAPIYLQTNAGSAQAELSQNLFNITPGRLKHTFLSVDGTGAVEAAIKAAKKVGGLFRRKIVAAQAGFHGKSMGSLSAAGGHYAEHFKPLMGGCSQVPYGDLVALSKAVNWQTALVLLEPVQGEGGVIIPPPGYLKGAEEIAHNAGALICYDEVQTGFGRTGKMFGCQLFADGSWQPQPDIMCMAKAIGGGVVSTGATIFTPEVWKKAYGKFQDCAIHTSTFGGNGWSCIAGNQTLHALLSNDMIPEVARKGVHFMERLEPLRKHPLVKDIRGVGLLIGIEFNVPLAIKAFAYEAIALLIVGRLLKEHRIITAYTLNRPNVMRLEPPLTISLPQIDQVVDALSAVLKRYPTASSLVNAAVKAGFGSKTK